MSPNKAKTMPLKKFYVDLRWTKVVKALENYGVSMSSIYDILSVLDSVKEPRAVNILVEGIVYLDIIQVILLSSNTDNKNFGPFSISFHRVIHCKLNL